jgi:hypothetical protein
VFFLILLLGIGGTLTYWYFWIVNAQASATVITGTVGNWLKKA